MNITRLDRRTPAPRRALARPLGQDSDTFGSFSGHFCARQVWRGRRTCDIRPSAPGSNVPKCPEMSHIFGPRRRFERPGPPESRLGRLLAGRLRVTSRGLCYSAPHDPLHTKVREDLPVGPWVEALSFLAVRQEHCIQVSPRQPLLRKQRPARMLSGGARRSRREPSQPRPPALALRRVRP